jgi:NAD(P)-dependent dehydrogenase (short-subunit alcohol dehydrogenase family)
MVTGGGSGIGQAACPLYSREGAKLVASNSDQKGGTQAVEAI